MYLFSFLLLFLKEFAGFSCATVEGVSEPFFRHSRFSKKESYLANSPATCRTETNILSRGSLRNTSPLCLCTYMRVYVQKM